ncbi:MAG: DUF4215 domain-containing protein [Deltaproteobacteria bacterium]|nr:DUF4215 domain-containing protein [Deltaproteobacteria bacterium]
MAVLHRRVVAVVLAMSGVVVAYGCGGDDGAGDATFPTPTGTPTGVPTGDFGPVIPGGEGGPAGPVCGNAAQELGEGCDDGNAKPGDGCSATCAVEPGWKCPTIGAACIAAGCGDGVVAGDEDCDDGNTKDADGCSATCVLEQGFKCPDPGKPCSATTCGDGKKEGTEQCDVGDVRPYDGCSPTCTIEPKCAGGTCTAVCGDGVKFPGEDCDDGNTRSGDGCSATCKLEAGFNCTVVTSDLPPTLDLPVIYRDFKGFGEAGGHPDFENYCCNSVKGLPKANLAADNAPELLSVGSPQTVDSAASFLDWYHDKAGVNSVVLDKLTLTKQPDDSYVFDSNSFFPLDGKGFGNTPGQAHNFHFTSEVRGVFTYKGGEVLEFRGDDDVFVYINGKLAVDIGGVHGAEAGSVTLDNATATSLGLTVNGMYEFAVFQAERHTSESNYKLTLRGFVKAKTSCTPICGDGIKTKNEACDDGKNVGGYGKCAPGCVLGPRCGDGVLQADQGEQCDDGNLVENDGCSSTCKVVAVVPK